MARTKTPEEKKIAKIKRIEKKIIKVIEENKLLFTDHIFANFHEISRRTFYEWGLHNSHDIKNAIFKQRGGAKNFLVNKWISSDNPTMNAMAMKLMATKDEYKRLTNQPLEEEQKTDNNFVIEVFDESTRNELKQLNESIAKEYPDTEIDVEPTDPSDNV